MRLITSLLVFAFLTSPILAQAQTTDINHPKTVSGVALPASPEQEMCMQIISSFPAENPSVRYQFFRLARSFGKGANPEFVTALDKFASQDVTMQTELTDVIEGMNNPVLRQADPALVAGYGKYLVNFATKCNQQIESQINALHAYDVDLKDVAFNIVIDEDALYLRQILSDSLYSLDGDKDPIYGAVIRAYANDLVHMRDNMEYTVFNAEIGDIEALYMGDLDEKLARSNDIVNSEMDREMLNSSIGLADDMSNSMIKQEKRRTVQTLINILNGYSRY